jgi:hypothetical protein
MMTPNRPGRDPYVLLLAALTWDERQVLYAHLNSGWAKQLYAVNADKALKQETHDILTDINNAAEAAAAYRDRASATCRTCGANGAAVELERITVRAVGATATRTEWLCADQSACTARKFHQLADTLAALATEHAPNREERAA